MSTAFILSHTIFDCFAPTQRVAVAVAAVAVVAVVVAPPVVLVPPPLASLPLLPNLSHMLSAASAAAPTAAVAPTSSTVESSARGPGVRGRFAGTASCAGHTLACGTTSPTADHAAHATNGIPTELRT